MRVEPEKTSPRDFYRYLIGAIVPRPIAWVSTLSPNNIPNLAPFSFFNGVCANPPTLCFTVVNNRHGGKKDTVRNLEARPEFTVNVVSFSNAAAMNKTSAEYPYETSEFAECGLAQEKSERIAPARVKDAAVQFECVVHQIVRVGEGPLAGNLVIGRIVLLHADDSVLDGHGGFDPAKLDLVGRMGGEMYARTTDRFTLPRP